MKKLSISFIVVLVLLFSFDRIGGMAMWWVNQHTHDISGPKIKHMANHVDDDVIFMGTSRCSLHYVPTIISDTINMSCYNGGVDASNCIYAHYILLNYLLSHHTPKIICLEVMTSDYYTAEGTNPTSTVGFFAPYFGRNEHADSIFRMAGTYWKYEVSHLYRYNSKAVSNIAGLLYNKQENSIKGYNPGAKPPFPPKELVRAETPATIDSTKIEYVQKFIDACYSHGVKLVFVVSPRYDIVDSTYYDPLKRVAHDNGIPFLDYHSKGLFHNHPEYFKDNAHLWDKGARLYSAIFASDLKKIIK